MAYNRKLSPTSFGGTLLCFLLPFMQLSCGPMAVSYSGFDLATGSEGSPVVPDGQKLGSSRKGEFNLPKELAAIAQPCTIIACFAIILALYFSLSITAFPNKLAAFAGSAAVTALVIMVLIINAEMSKPPAKSFRIDYGVGIWLVGIATVIGIVVNLVKIGVTVGENTNSSGSTQA